jgi:DNA recombination protein RmuC
MNEIVTEFLPQANLQILFVAILAFIMGALVTALWMMRTRHALERENTELRVRLQAGQEALVQAGEVLDARFKATAQDALAQSTQAFMQLAQEKLKNAQADTAHDLDKRQRAIDEMVKPVKEQLAAMKGALEQVQGTDKSLREEMQILNRETARLVGALRDPAAQGKWGEYILEGLLQKSGLMKGIHYETQISMQTEQGRQRPDAIIRMQDGFNIIVDAKAPLNEFSQRLGQDMSENDFTDLTLSLARQVREHVKALGKKEYWENIDSPDFTVMFMPSEHLYALSLRADPSLVDFAAERNIIIASPTLLMSLIRVVGMSWRQVELAQNAKEISERGYDLYKRLLTFTSHMDKVGKNIGAALRGYNDAVGSLERSVLPAARKFKDLQGSASTTPELTIIAQEEDTPRTLILAADDEIEKEKKQAQA